MYKNLNPAAIGISGRQSELIELAMTYGFKGLAIDLGDMWKRVKRSDLQHATRYLRSAEIAVSGFELPISLDADEDTFKKAVSELPEAIEIASEIKASGGSLRLPAATDRLPYHEYFEVLRKRVSQISELMTAKGLRVGLYFSAAAEDRADKQFKFVSDVEGFLAFYNAVRSDAIGMTLDTWAWHVGGGTVEQLKQIDAASIIGLRLSDAPAEFAPDRASVKERTMPGEGLTIQNVDYVTHLASAKYKGPVAVAAHPSTMAGMTRDAIVSHAQDCLDKVLTAAGVPTETRKPEMFVELYQPAYANAE